MKPNLLLLLGAVVTVLALAAGCDSMPKVKVPEKVLVPTPVPCVDAARRPERPALRSDAELMALDRYRRTLAAWSERLKHQAYTAQLEAIVEGCSRIPNR